MITDEQINGVLQDVDSIAVDLDKVDAGVVTKPLSKGMVISFLITDCVRRRKFKDTNYGAFETTDKRDVAFSTIANVDRANDLELDTSSWLNALKDFIKKGAQHANANGVFSLRISDSQLVPSPFDPKRNTFVYRFAWV